MGEDLFETLKRKYSYETSAEALFFHDNKGYKALRVEARDIGVEFTDGSYIGTDPAGVVYYNYRDHFDSGDQVNYKVTREINPYDSKVLAHIKFYTVDETLCHAEFLAYDLQETVNGASMNGYSHSGKWQNLTLGSVTATIKKGDDERTLHLTVTPLGKKAQWPDQDIQSRQEALHGKAVNVNGMLYVKNFNTLTTAIYANYNDDRIVFYANDYTGTDFVAFFIPFESWPRTLEVKANRTAVFENISWSNA